MTKVLIAFALKEEFAPWRRRHHFRPVSTSQPDAWRSELGFAEVYAALVGAGARDTEHFRDLTAQIGPSLGIVTGVAAALKPEWRPGDMLVAQSVSGLDGEARIPARSDLVDLAEHKVSLRKRRIERDRFTDGLFGDRKIVAAQEHACGEEIGRRGVGSEPILARKRPAGIFITASVGVAEAQYIVWIDIGVRDSTVSLLK